MLTMEEALKQRGALPFAAGNIVKGTIIEVRPKEVLVDIGYKSEGVISANEFEDIKTVKDIKGRKIGYSQGTNAHYYLLKLLDEATASLDLATEAAVTGSSLFAQVSGRLRRVVPSESVISSVNASVLVVAPVNASQERVKSACALMAWAAA